jgi:hypothetical protein
MHHRNRQNSLSPNSLGKKTDTAGGETTLVLTVNPATAVTATVTIKDGSTTIASLSLVDSSASFATSTLAVGTHSLNASYSGDPNSVRSSATGSVTITAQ